MQYLLLIPLLLPIIYGMILLGFKIENNKKTNIISLCVICAVSVAVWVSMLVSDGKSLMFLNYSSAICFGFRIDGLGKIFAGMISVLWPIALAYSFVYMKHDERKNSYHGFYIMTYGIVLGIAFSANAITMYVFYEILTFVTLPLIIHTRTREARRASRYYLYYSLSGSSLALSGIIIIIMSTGSCDFLPGGIVNSSSDLLNLAYLLTFFGFGVKAAVFPLCRWLPMASAAPTPTTALLHAVAVVKSGAFAVMRMTYYVFSGSSLYGSTVQKIAIGFAAISVIYGSAMALKEQHFKRRFAYSTVANLSYILCGTLLCTNAGLVAATMHFLFHSITKIGIFFCIGAIIETNKAEYVYQLNGMAKKSPRIFAIFTVSGLSLIGIPLFAGFVSKYYLISSSVATESVFGYVAAGAIIISAILTAGYVLSVCFRAYFRKPMGVYSEIYEKASEPCNGFLVTSGIFAASTVVFGIFASPIYNLVCSLLGGVV